MREVQSSPPEGVARFWRVLLAALVMALLAHGAQAQGARFQKRFGFDNAPLFIHPGAIEQTSDGGMIAVGAAGPAKGFFVVKLAADGALQWQEFLTPQDSIGGIHVNIRQTSDGGYILAGRTLLIPIVLIKLAANGSLVWAKAYDTQSVIADFDSPQVREMAGGGFAVVGTEVNLPASSLAGVLLLTDGQGNVIGGGKYFSSGGVNIGFSDLRQNADGGFTIAGWLGFSSDPKGSLLALRTSPPPSAGTPPPIVWAEDFNNPFGSSTFSNMAVEQVAGGFVFAASEPSGTLLVRTDLNGISTWTTSFEGFFANSVHATHSSGLLLGGSAGSSRPINPAIVETDGNGAFVNGMSYTQSGEGSEATPTTDGGALLAAGISAGLPGFLVIKTDAALSSGCLEAHFAPIQKRGADGDSVTLTRAGGFTVANLAVPVSSPVFFSDSFFCAEAPCIAPPANMTLWLPLDELAGPTALNAAGGNNGTHQRNPIPTTGFVGNGLCFDGQQSYVEVPSYPAIDFGLEDFSIDAWIRRSPGDDGVRNIVDKRQEVVFGGRVLGYSFFLLDGRLWFQLADGRRPYSNYDSGATVPADGLWHHVAVTVSRHNSTGGRFYIDGRPAGVPFNPLDHTGSLASGYPLRVGSRSSSVSAVFQGCIDEVETFGRALGAGEIAALHAAGSSGKCKLSCHAPWASVFCSGDSLLNTAATVCSSMATQQTFRYSFQGMPVGAACPATGPTAFTPSSGTIVVQPGTCASVPVTITRPSTLAAHQISCYSLFGETAGGTLTTACRGSVQNSPDLCPFSGGGGTGMTFDNDVSILFFVRNTGSGNQSFHYEVAALTDQLAQTSAVSLNGLPPGTPVQRTIDLPAGASTPLDVLAGFREYQPGRFYTLLAQADLKGDGTLVPLASTLLQNVIPATCNPPSIAGPPPGQTVAAGQPLTISVVATSAGQASYRWRRNGIDLMDGGTLSGTASSSLTIAPASFADAGLYEVVVANDCGVTTSAPVAVSVTGASCTPGPTTLCLNSGRFAVQASWRNPQGDHGNGHAVQVTSETGYVWFFDPSNAELAIKVLDGCGLDGRFWVFATGLTNLEVAITVTDTRTGAVRHYNNPGGQAFLPIQDTSAFATCTPALRPNTEPLGKLYGSRNSLMSSASSSLLLLRGRFRVEAHWQDGPGKAGDGQAVELSKDSGAFWFFDSANLEVFVKVLDGCNAGAHFWVFAGGLTNVHVELKVTDTLTGAVKTYTNPAGRAFLPIQDTSAFATCP